MSDPRSRSLATHWARDVGAYASMYRPQDEPEAWAVYVKGLDAAYTRWGVAEVLDRARLDRLGCTVFWLIHDVDGRCIGGLRAEGPFERGAEYKGLAEMAASPQSDRLTMLINREAALGGLVEFKGAWTTPGNQGLGEVIARFIQHGLWWLEARRGFCVTAAHARAAWESVGGVRVEGVEPARYPNDDYESVMLLWNDDHRLNVAPHQGELIAAERRYLGPARERHLGRSGLDAWHPEILFDFDDRFRELIADGVAVSDAGESSRRELSELRPPIDEHLRVEPQTWIYLPWRRRAVRVPGPSGYWRLRTDRNRHKIHDDELSFLRGKTVGVVGLSVGSSAAFTVAQEGLCGSLRLADFDLLSLSNLNRLSASIVDLDTPKTQVVARRIAELDPYLSVELFDEGVTDHNIEAFVEGLDVVIEECDSLDVKLAVRRQAAAAGVPVIMETTDQGLLDVERFDLEPDRPAFHGLVAGVDADELKSLSTSEKVPFVLSILEPDKLSAEVAASMVEIDATTRTWPQLASDVALGASLVTTSVRTLFTHAADLRSGRVRLDLQALLAGLDDPAAPSVAAEPQESTDRRPLPHDFDQAILAAARLAPSGGNMQPWRFTIADEAFEVWDSGDALVGMDIGRRGTAVACGTALANALAVAAAHSRLGPALGNLDLSVDLDRPDLVGRLLLGSETDPIWAALAVEVPRRVSNRRHDASISSAPLDGPTLSTLEAATIAGGGRLHYLPTADLGEVVDAWAEADRIRFLTPLLHKEMMSELRRPGVDPMDDGLDERTLELAPDDQAKLAILRRYDVMAELDHHDGGSRLGDDTRRRLRSGSGLVVVSVSGHSRADYVRGGVALQRLWLTASRLGLWLQPMSPIFGYARSKDELAEIVRPDRAGELHDMGQRALRVIGLAPADTFVLAARIFAGPPPSAISLRREVGRAMSFASDGPPRNR